MEFKVIVGKEGKTRTVTVDGTSDVPALLQVILYVVSVVIALTSSLPPLAPLEPAHPRDAEQDVGLPEVVQIKVGRVL